MERTYIAIDLKSFYASVECAQRGLNPLTTNLVVADIIRTEKTICLAVSPSLKAYGLPGRCRLFEVNQKLREIKNKTGKQIDYIVATPQMALYLKYSANIYATYLKYVSCQDIHVYSIDEVFIDVTEYLSLYQTTAHQLALRMIKDVLNHTGITATAGIGTNLYLAKIAMDIVAKHLPADQDGVRIAELNEQTYRETLWDYKPLSGFWRIGKGLSSRLEKKGLYTMGDIAKYSLTDEDWFFKEFGVDGEIIIDHAWGYEPVGLHEIKNYKPASNSISSGQVLSGPYSIAKAKIVLKEMVEASVLDLTEKKQVTNSIFLYIGYSSASLQNGDYQGNIETDHYGRNVPKPLAISTKLSTYTNILRPINQAFMQLYDKNINKSLLVTRINIGFNNLQEEKKAISQMDLFSDVKDDAKEKKIQETLNVIKKRYGKNAVMKVTSLEEGATMKERNKQIGGHKA